MYFKTHYIFTLFKYTKHTEIGLHSNLPLSHCVSASEKSKFCADIPWGVSCNPLHSVAWMFTSWKSALLGQQNTLHNGSLRTGWRKDTWAFSWSKVSKTIPGYHLSRNTTATVAPLSKLTSSKSDSTLSTSFTRGLGGASESLASESTSRSWGWSVPLGRSWGWLVLVYRCNQYSVYGDSSVVRALDSWLKGPGFKSLWERRENFLLHGRLSVLTLISVSVPPLCYRSST